MTRTLALWLSASCVIAACASEDKTPLDESALDAIDVEGKDDSLRSPTLKGAMAMGDVATSRVTRTRSFHAYDYTYAGQQGLVRLDARNMAGEDLIVAAYRRTGTTWKLAAWNDDCGDGSLNACLALPATAGRYRFVISTFDALVGAPRAADYTFTITCKDGDCLAPAACGGLQGLACPDGQFCAYAPADICGAADAMGTCAPRPEVCTAQYAPVCGCDDRTYGNACEAAANGVSVISEGECPAVACGARAGDTCGADQFCSFALGDVCGRADAQGTCEARPEVCPQDYTPVCGCDNVTYSNECAAAAAGVGVLASGACVPE